MTKNQPIPELSALDRVLRPRSIAVVGASASPGKIGYTVLSNIIRAGYKGRLYPVNPKEETILGLKVHPTVNDIPDEVDTAVFCVPARLCAEVAEQCGRKGVKGLIVISSGFSETGRHDLEDELVAITRRYGMRMLGPNVVGIMSNSDRLNASFASSLPYPGKPSLVSQSGALIVAVDAASYARHVGFDKMISVGNMSDVDFADCIEWLDKDPNTTCISLYVEGLKNGRRVIDAARRCQTPIIALKAGVSAQGAAAAASHTGSLAGATKVYEAAFKQAGIVNAADLNSLFDRSLALSLQPPMRGDNLLVLTNGGGVGVLATDSAEKLGLPLGSAPADLQAGLRRYMPEYGSARNPVDLTGMADKERYYGAVKTCLTHPWVDGLVIIFCETSLTVPVEVARSIRQAIADSKASDKPVAIAVVGGERSTEAMHWLISQDIPAYEVPDKAVSAVAALREYAKIRSMLTEIQPMPNPNSGPGGREIIQRVRAEGRRALTEVEAKQVFAAYGLPVAATVLAKSEEAAVRAAAGIGFPVVLKVVSPDILHKSDAGCVKVNLKNESEVRQAYRFIITNAKAYQVTADIQGVAVQEMAPAGTEVILGSVNDPSFGPSVMFGLGGIFVEILKDVTFRVAPVTSTQAERMLDEIAAAPILKGARGEAPRDRDALVQTIMAYSRMIIDLEDEVAESDANPILVYEEGKGLKVVDARIILKQNRT